MDRPTIIKWRIGEWCVDPAAGQITRPREDSDVGEVVRVEARTLRLLIYLAEHAGEVVGSEELLSQVWSGVIVTQDSVYQAIASLRRLLGDDPKQPRYIATVPRLGYRMIAKVSQWEDAPSRLRLAPPEERAAAHPSEPAPAPPDERAATPPSEPAANRPGEPARAPADHPATALPGVPAATPPSAPRSKKPGPARSVAAAIAALCLALVGGILLYNHLTGRAPPRATPAAPQSSVAVLPFLDLTSEAMDQEYFADGMTEELIDRLSRVPGIHVPAPTSSFYFKGRHATVPEIARALGVSYVLDGSVRKSNTTLRIAARLVRASDGYIVWSGTYDRPLEAELAAQDDIASEVTKALTTAIH